MGIKNTTKGNEKKMSGTNNRIKFVIVNSKGGVSKTFNAVQILVPYLYSKFGEKVKFLSLDDVNKADESFKNSEILDLKMANSDDMETVVSFLSSRKPCVIDTAGNEASNTSIQLIGDSGELDNVIWIVPVSDGDEDAMNAEQTIQRIREIDVEAVIVLALSKALSTEKDEFEKQFAYIFTHKYLNPEFSLLERNGDFPVIVSTLMGSYTFTKILGKTIYELGSKEYLEELKEQRNDFSRQLDEIDDEDSDEFKRIDEKKKENIFINSVANSCKRYREIVLERTVFPKLDAILENER